MSSSAPPPPHPPPHLPNPAPPHTHTHAQVADFGLSKIVSSSVSMVDTSKWGTVSFMAPEHFTGQLVGADRGMLLGG